MHTSSVYFRNVVDIFEFDYNIKLFDSIRHLSMILTFKRYIL